MWIRERLMEGGKILGEMLQYALGMALIGGLVGAIVGLVRGDVATCAVWGAVLGACIFLVPILACIGIPLALLGEAFVFLINELYVSLTLVLVAGSIGGTFTPRFIDSEDVSESRTFGGRLKGFGIGALAGFLLGGLCSVIFSASPDTMYGAIGHGISHFFH